MRNTLIGVFIEVSKRLSQRPNGYGNLVFTHRNGEERKVAEPEAKFILASVLSEMNISFGLEVPTKRKYIREGKSSGKGNTRGNTDLVVNPLRERVNVEVKEGQPPENYIRADFEKLLREPASGCAFYNILQNSNRRTLPRLLEKCKNSYRSLEDVSDRLPKWFILFIDVRKKRMCFWKVFDNIGELTEQSFEFNSFDSQHLKVI